jgi:hypothetical protein
MRTLRTWVLLLFLVGCTSAPPPGPGPAPDDPAAAFRALEDRLLQAGTVRLHFGVTAEGVIAAELRGALEMTPDGGIRLTASGQFDGQAVNVLLQCEAGGCAFGNAGNPVTAARPAQLKEAVVIGFTRMGILHNLARLTGGKPPDHAQGGVREWVVASSFAEDPENPSVMSFELTVAGAPVGTAKLQIDARGRPVFRRQTVQFPSGQMRVVEWYSAITIERSRAADTPRQ